jgi:hypothetical protein
MLDVDSRLDSRLRSFYEHIEAEVPPSRLTEITSEPSRTHSRRLNLVLVSATLALVTVAVVGFAIELRTHLDHTNPAGSAVHTTPTPRPTPAPTFTINPLPTIPGNAVANAGFANPPVRAVTTVTSLPDWTVTGEVELVPARTIGEPFYGNQYLVLESGPVQGEVSQRVKTVPGTNYEVIFTTGDAPACRGSGTLDLYWNGRYAESTGIVTSVQTSSSGLGWSTDGYVSALATSTYTTVSFVGAGDCGASLNQVIVQPYPLPAG